MRAILEALPDGAAGLRAKITRIRELVESSKRDPRFRSRVLELVSDLGERDHSGEIARVVRFVRDGIRYVRDPHKVELFTDPRVLLEQIDREGKTAGDCDDHVLLASAMLEVLGYPTRYRVGGLGQERYVHIWLEVQHPKRGWTPIELTRELPIGYDPSATFPVAETHLGAALMGYRIRDSARAGRSLRILNRRGGSFLVRDEMGGDGDGSRDSLAVRGGRLLVEDSELGKLKIKKLFKKAFKMVNPLFALKQLKRDAMRPFKMLKKITKKKKRAPGEPGPPDEMMVPALPPPLYAEPEYGYSPRYQPAEPERGYSYGPIPGPMVPTPHVFQSQSSPWPQSTVPQSAYVPPGYSPPQWGPDDSAYNAREYAYDSPEPSYDDSGEEPVYDEEPGSDDAPGEDLDGLVSLGTDEATGQAWFADHDGNTFAIDGLGKFKFKKIFKGVKKVLKSKAIRSLVSFIPIVGPVARLALDTFSPDRGPRQRGAPEAEPQTPMDAIRYAAQEFLPGLQPPGLRRPPQRPAGGPRPPMPRQAAPGGVNPLVIAAVAVGGLMLMGQGRRR